MAVLVPAILTPDKGDLEEKIKLLESIPEVDEIQIDFEDGRFVPNTTVLPHDLHNLKTKLKVEAHLMVESPQQYFHDLEAFGADTVILHYESFTSTGDLSVALGNARAMGFKTGIAINPVTELSVLKNFATNADLFCVLGVAPGFQGRQFLPSTLDKLEILRKDHPNAIIEADGGVKLENIESIVAHGANRVVVGSAIWLSRNPKKTIQEFLNKVSS